ncbi:MAG: hypothetical protein ACRDBX_02325 [Erysipelotrichaceae bacterium]
MKLETQIQILKYAHEPRTRNEICEKFEIEDRTIRNHFNKGDIIIDNVIIPLDLTKSIKGRTVLSNDKALKNKKLGEDQFEYRASVHPIFLPLNLTEVNMLTNELLDHLKDVDEATYEAYKHLAAKIYSQLSDYGKTRIGNRHEMVTLGEIRYESEATLKSELEGFDLMYAFKSGDAIQVECDGHHYVGKVLYENGGFYLDTTDKKISLKQLRTTMEK